MQCFVCDGKGKDYSWKHRDPIEGWKMASKQVCLFCDGEGVIRHDDSRMPGVVAYVEALKGVEQRRKDDNERREADRAKRIKSAREKLTPEELEALGLNSR